MAYDPTTGNTEVIGKKLYSANIPFSPSALHEADVDPSNGRITNYRVSRVGYLRTMDVDLGGGTMFTFPDALMKVGVAAGSGPSQVTDESRDSIDLGLISPHRLIRVTYEGDSVNDSFEVIAVNTRTSDSLNHLMTKPASDDDVESGAGSTAPVNGF
ncbi:hypothetical protein [uncultured Marinobacter sp.]|uniref:hypothetical protein n=1 Tax=uncultured Marinobacter sp. TaxID=187379 RepID=UPI002629EC23|nr:hypothetical protein [uncultured Marinobacter sp.]